MLTCLQVRLSLRSVVNQLSNEAQELEPTGTRQLDMACALLPEGGGWLARRPTQSAAREHAALAEDASFDDACPPRDQLVQPVPESAGARPPLV